MKLLHSPTSPFARKVLACAIARGIEGQITLVPAENGSPEVLEHNPLGNLPCLITNDGVSLFDSRVICEFARSTSSMTATTCCRTTMSVDCQARLVRHSSATYSCVKAG